MNIVSEKNHLRNYPNFRSLHKYSKRYGRIIHWYLQTRTNGYSIYFLRLHFHTIHFSHSQCIAILRGFANLYSLYNWKILEFNWILQLWTNWIIIWFYINVHYTISNKSKLPAISLLPEIYWTFKITVKIQTTIFPWRYISTFNNFVNYRAFSEWTLFEK